VSRSIAASYFSVICIVESWLSQEIADDEVSIKDYQLIRLAPCSTKAEPSNKVNDGGNSQKLMLFSLGNAISGAPMYKGTNQFPNPPINTGLTSKNTITKPSAVTITSYN